MQLHVCSLGHRAAENWLQRPKQWRNCELLCWRVSVYVCVCAHDTVPLSSARRTRFITRRLEAEPSAVDSEARTPSGLAQRLMSIFHDWSACSQRGPGRVNPFAHVLLAVFFDYCRRSAKIESSCSGGPWFGAAFIYNSALV